MSESQQSAEPTISNIEVLLENEPSPNQDGVSAQESEDTSQIEETISNIEVLVENEPAPKKDGISAHESVDTSQIKETISTIEVLVENKPSPNQDGVSAQESENTSQIKKTITNIEVLMEKPSPNQDGVSAQESENTSQIKKTITNVEVLMEKPSPNQDGVSAQESENTSQIEETISNIEILVKNEPSPNQDGVSAQESKDTSQIEETISNIEVLVENEPAPKKDGISAQESVDTSQIKETISTIEVLVENEPSPKQDGISAQESVDTSQIKETISNIEVLVENEPSPNQDGVSAQKSEDTSQIKETISNIEVLVENEPSPNQDGVSAQESEDTSQIKETVNTNSNFNAQENADMSAKDSYRKRISALPPVVTNNVDDNQSNENNKTNSVEGSVNNTMEEETTKSPLKHSSKEIDEFRPILTTVVSAGPDEPNTNTVLTNHKNTIDVSTELVVTDCPITQVFDESCDGRNTTDNDNSNHAILNAVSIHEIEENTPDSLEMNSEEINISAHDSWDTSAKNSDRKRNSALPPVVTNNVDDNQSNQNNKTNSDDSVEGSVNNTMEEETTKSSPEHSSKEIDEFRPILTTVVSAGPDEPNTNTVLTNHINTNDMSTQLVVTDCPLTRSMLFDGSCDGHNITDNDNSNHPLPNAVRIQENEENTPDSLEMKSEKMNISAHGSEPTTMNTPSSTAQNISVDSCNNNKSSQISSENNSITNIPLAGEAIENQQIKIEKNKKNGKPPKLGLTYLTNIYILKFLGFLTKVSNEEATEAITAQVKQHGLPELVFSLEEEKKVAECTVISTSNWPTWIRPGNLRFVLFLFTDTKLGTTRHLIETLRYKDMRKMGAALIHFTTPEECMHIFKQLRAINLFIKKVQVELDLESKTRNTLMGKYIYGGVLSTENKWHGLKTNNDFISAEKKTRQSVTLTEAPLNHRADLVRSYSLRLVLHDDQQKADMTEILNLLGLQSGSLKKIKNAIWNKTTHFILTLPEPPLSKTCSSIYINNVPTWFEDLHFMYLLEITTRHNWNKVLYYLEILQYSNGVNRGAALLRLPHVELCRDIFKQLRRICFLKEKTPFIDISLDIDGEIEKQITIGPPKVPWQTPAFPTVFRSRYVITNVEMPPTHTLDKPPLVPRPNASETQTKYSSQQSDETSNRLPESQSHRPHIHSSSEPPAKIVKTEFQIKNDNTAENIDLKQRIDEQLMDIDFKGVMVEENSNTRDNNISQSENIAMSSAGTTSGAQERKEKIIHLKFTPSFINITHNFYKLLLMGMAQNQINEKYYVMRFLRSATNKILNECLIKFETPEDAFMVAQSLDGKTWKNYSLEAKLIEDSELLSSSFVNPLKRSLDCGTEDMEDSISYKRAKFDDEWAIRCGTRTFFSGNGRTEEKFGMNPNVLRNLGVKKCLVTAVTVNNVHEDVTENKLREVFSLAGKVYAVQMGYGKRTGKAKVDYYHPVEALQAISMLNGQKLYNSALRVTLCTEPAPKALPNGLEGVGPGFGNDGQPIADIPTYLEMRKIYDVFHRMGQFAKITKDTKDHPFQSYYISRNVTQNPTVSVGTAIEAFGTVLVALNLIPSGTDHTNLTEIIKELQKNGRVQQHMKDKSKKDVQQAQGPNSNHQVEKFFEHFSGLIEQYTSTQSTANLQSLLEMIVANPRQSTSAVHTSNMHPNIQNVPLGLPNTNPNMQSAPGGMSNMQRATSGMPIMSSNMQSDPGGMPNMISHMQSATSTIPIMSPHMQSTPGGMPNMQSATSAMHYMGTNIESAPGGMTNMIPNMQSATSAMPYMGTNIESAPGGMPYMIPNMQSATSAMSYMGTNIESAPGSMPNMIPNMQSATSHMPYMGTNIEIAPGGMPNMISNMQSATSHMPYMGTNIESAPGGMPNMIPNMQSATSAMPYMRTNIESAPGGMPNMIPNMQSATSSVPYMGTNIESAPGSKPKMQSAYSSFGHTYNMNPKKPNPRNLNKGAAHLKLNKKVPEASAPPRWGDPRFQDMFAANNVTQQDPAVNQGVPRGNSNAITPKRRQPNQSSSQHMGSHPSQPHYDPRDDSGEDSSDHFESDLLQFKNLPSSVTAKALTGKMKEIGEIIFVEMTSKGRALIRFKRAADAERCIRLFHRSKVDGHIIDVTPV